MEKITVLFDLDDTLIADFSNKFMPVYIKALGDWIKDVPPEKVVPGIRSATRKMMVKNGAAGTLQEIFNWNFYTQQGLSKETLSPVIESFYGTRFPELESYIKPIPGIQEMMAQIREMGHDIAIATNPLFPRIATLSRVIWAGFSELDISNFKLISTYEDFHFCKPNRAYYAEVLGRMGSEDQPVVMIGDSLEMDIKPAEALGFATYWVDVSEPSNGRGPLSSGGNRDEIPEWISRISGSLKSPFSNRNMLLAILDSTPAVLDGFIRSDLNSHKEKLKNGISRLIQNDNQTFDKLSQTIQADNQMISEDEIKEKENYYALLDPEIRSYFLSRQRVLDLIKNIPAQEWGNAEVLSFIKDLAEYDRDQIRMILN